MKHYPCYVRPHMGIFADLNSHAFDKAMNSAHVWWYIPFDGSRPPDCFISKSSRDAFCATGDFVPISRHQALLDVRYQGYQGQGVHGYSSVGEGRHWLYQFKAFYLKYCMYMLHEGLREGQVLKFHDAKDLSKLVKILKPVIAEVIS